MEEFTLLPEKDGTSNIEGPSWCDGESRLRRQTDGVISLAEAQLHRKVPKGRLGSEAFKIRRCPSCTAPIDDATASSPDHLFSPPLDWPAWRRADSFKRDRSCATRPPEASGPLGDAGTQGRHPALEALRSSSTGRSLRPGVQTPGGLTGVRKTQVLTSACSDDGRGPGHASPAPPTPPGLVS